MTQQNSLVDLSNLSLGAVNDPLESEADELSRSVFNSATAARPSRARGRRLPATIRRDVEPDDGRCLAGVLSPMLVGKLAHRIIQADAEAFHEIDIETTIPSKAKSRGVRADLYGVWREDEARARGISFVPNPNNDTPYAVAEIGEIKPVSYSPGGPRHGAAKAQMSRYFSEWKQFSKIPVVPMISLPDMKSRPFLFATNIESTNIGGGLYIYSCSGKADPLRYGQPVAVTNPARALRPTTSEPGATKQQPILNLPAGSRLLVASVAKSIAALQSVEEQGTAAARFVAEHKTEAAAIAAAVALGIATGGLAIALGLVGGEALVGLSALIAVFAP